MTSQPNGCHVLFLEYWIARAPGDDSAGGLLLAPKNALSSFYIACICKHGPRTGAAGRLRLFARRRSDDHPGHPLRRFEQFHRPAAEGLWRRRMRGEARGGAEAEGRSGGAFDAQTFAEDAG